MKRDWKNIEDYGYYKLMISFDMDDLNDFYSRKDFDGKDMERSIELLKELDHPILTPSALFVIIEKITK